MTLSLTKIVFFSTDNHYFFLNEKVTKYLNTLISRRLATSYRASKFSEHVPRVERGIHQMATTCMGMSPTNTHMSSSYNNYFSHERILRQENYWIITACHLLHSEWFRHDTISHFPTLHPAFKLLFHVMRGRCIITVPWEMIKAWCPDHPIPEHDRCHQCQGHCPLSSLTPSVSSPLAQVTNVTCYIITQGNPMCWSRTLCQQTNYICHIIVICAPCVPVVRWWHWDISWH